jgi:hypothetical protein
MMVLGEKQYAVYHVKTINLAFVVLTMINGYLFCRYGSWAVCFTYGTFFAVKGLVAAGRTYENSSYIRKACNFLLSKQQITGGWGESYISVETEVIQRRQHFIFCIL